MSTSASTPGLNQPVPSTPERPPARSLQPTNNSEANGSPLKRSRGNSKTSMINTFTSCLSIPVIGTKPISQPADSANSNSSISATNNNHGTVVEPAGPPIPTPSMSSGGRMSRTSAKQTRMSTANSKPPSTSRNQSNSGVASNDLATSSSSSSSSSASSSQSRDRAPPLGVEPIQAPVKLDLGSVRCAANRSPAPAKEARPFELEDVPVFYPDELEFADPIKYIKSIGPKAKEYGICKVVPPEGWKMPFVTNTETFRFTSRVQRLNQVEASTRAKINFLEQLYRYHKQNSANRVIIPTINGRLLDVWLLRKEVHKLGGFNAVSKANKWGDIGRTMGYSGILSVGAQLKLAYQKIVVPYDNFLTHVRNSPTLTPGGHGRTGVNGVLPESPTVTRMTKIGNRGAPVSIVDRALERQQAMDANGISGTDTNARTKQDAVDASSKDGESRTAGPSSKAKDNSEGADVGEYCEICKGLNRPTEMLLCDGCDGGYHIFCLDPPLPSVPKGQWFCHSCLDGSNQEFGFDEGEDHSLMTFQARDLAFRKLWFESHPPERSVDSDVHDDFDPSMLSQVGEVTLSEYDVEREFWRLVQSSEDTVETEYGADVHSTTHGSAMPTLETHPTHDMSRDPWNLNNLPIISDSLLRFIKSDISGMTVPWTYVGMVFSTFCWHNEDHYTYSINYMHWGETKTWYSVPGSAAEKFEEALRSEAPELFDSQPDLLFQLVTLMKPDRLKLAGVPVYACNQRPNEFVITFPKAYHAGFNHGLNFNEAVNFALPDWLPLGLESVKRYKENCRSPVFSHDELLVTITQHATSIKTSIWLQDHIKEMYARELQARERIRSEVANIREVIEDQDRPEEPYSCLICKSFCYLSQVTCLCTSEVTCHDHIQSLCSCDLSSRILRLRMPDKDLADLLGRVMERASQPQAWRLKLSRTLAETPRPQIRTLRALVAEGERINYPLPELANLRKFVAKANDWIEAATQLVKRKESTRKKNKRTKNHGTPNLEDEKRDQTLKDALVLLDEIEKLGFDAPEIAVLTSVIGQAREFKERALELLQKLKDETESANDRQLREKYQAECQELLRMASTSNITMEETAEVELLLKKYQLLNDLDELQEDSLTLSEVRLHLERAKQCGLASDQKVVEMLSQKRALGEKWEAKAHAIFAAPIKNSRDLDEFADLPSGHPVDASVLAKIGTIRAKAREFERQAKALMFPEGPKRTKISDAVRLVNRAEKEFSIPAVTELKRVLEFATDLEIRCEAVLNKRHPQSDKESVFDSIRKWRVYAEEHLTNKFHLPQFDLLKNQLDMHDKWYSRLPFPKPRREHVEALYKDVTDCTKIEDDAAPTEEYCTCICTKPVRPPPPGVASDAVQCDHCHARFHPQCAGGSCPFCDHHHWNGSLHRTRYYHSFDVLAAVRPVPDLTKNYSRLWKQIEFIATRIARLQNVITHFLAFAAQAGNQRVEIIPQVRHYMRKLFKIQLAISPKPNVSYGLDLAGLHRILAGQKKAMKKKRRPKFVFRQDQVHTVIDGILCICNGNPPTKPAVLVMCSHCRTWYHSMCLNAPIPADPNFLCPACAIRRGKDYPHAEIRIRAIVDDGKPDMFINLPATIEHGGRELIRCSMGPANGPVIILELISYTPPEAPPPVMTAAAGTGPMVPAVYGHSPVASNSQARKRKQPDERAADAKRRKPDRISSISSSGPREIIDLTSEAGSDHQGPTQPIENNGNVLSSAPFTPIQASNGPNEPRHPRVTLKIPPIVRQNGSGSQRPTSSPTNGAPELVPPESTESTVGMKLIDPYSAPQGETPVESEPQPNSSVNPNSAIEPMEFLLDRSIDNS